MSKALAGVPEITLDAASLRCTRRAMATDFDNSIDELERSYEEAQARMSDPSVYNDHREAAEVGRRLKELEAPHKLALEWRPRTSDLAAARDDADLRSSCRSSRSAPRARGGARLALVRADPADQRT